MAIDICNLNNWIDSKGRQLKSFPTQITDLDFTKYKSIELTLPLQFSCLGKPIIFSDDGVSSILANSLLLRNGQLKTNNIDCTSLELDNADLTGIGIDRPNLNINVSSPSGTLYLTNSKIRPYSSKVSGVATINMTSNIDDVFSVSAEGDTISCGDGSSVPETVPNKSGIVLLTSASEIGPSVFCNTKFCALEKESINKGQINGVAMFDESINDGIVNEGAIFINESINKGILKGSFAAFKQSINEKDIMSEFTLFIEDEAINKGKSDNTLFFGGINAPGGFIRGQAVFCSQAKNSGVISGRYTAFSLKSIHNGIIDNRSSDVVFDQSISSGARIDAGYMRATGSDIIETSISCARSLEIIDSNFSTSTIYETPNIGFVSSNISGCASIITSGNVYCSGAAIADIQNMAVTGATAKLFFDQGNSIINVNIQGNNIVVLNSIVDECQIVSNSISSSGSTYNKGEISFVNKSMFSDGCISTSTINYSSDLIFNVSVNDTDGIINLIQNVSGQPSTLQFVDNSLNKGELNISTLNSNISFNRSKNLGLINSQQLQNDILFINRSINDGTNAIITSPTAFIDKSINNGEIQSSVIFDNESINNGIVNSQNDKISVFRNKSINNGDVTTFFDVRFENKCENNGQIDCTTKVEFINQCINTNLINSQTSVYFYNNCINNGDISSNENVICENSILNNGNIISSQEVLLTTSSINQGTINSNSTIVTNTSKNYGQITGQAVKFDNNSENFGILDVSDVVFESNSANLADLNNVNNIKFQNSSYNFNEIQADDVEFTKNSENRGTVKNNNTTNFTEGSYNYGFIEGDAFFDETSFNYGSVDGECDGPGCE